MKSSFSFDLEEKWFSLNLEKNWNMDFSHCVPGNVRSNHVWLLVKHQRHVWTFIVGTKTLCGQSSLSSPSSFSSPWSLSSQRSFSSPSETPKSNSVQFLPSERLCFGGAPRIFQIKYFANMSEKVELLEIWKRTTTLLMWPWPVRMVSSWKLTRWSWLDRSS